MAAQSSLQVAYLTTKYPLLSETFIYEELLALLDLGFSPRFFAYFNTGKSAHKYAATLDKMVVYLPPPHSIPHGVAHQYFIRTQPALYKATLSQIIRDTLRKPMILAKSLYAFGKGVSLAYILKSDPPHHLHAHWATMPTTSAFVTSQLLNIPYSFTAHAWDIFKEAAMLPTKLKTAAFSITISNHNRDHLSQIYPPAADRIKVVRCGINLNRFRYRGAYPIINPPHIFTVGRLVGKKGLHWLVEACGILQRQGLDFTCTIVGDGPERPLIENAILRNGLQRKVTLKGGMPQEELQALWNTASVFVLPCLITPDGNRDGIPVVLMEAMASGLPVISTNISGIPELIDDGVTGLLVPQNEAVELSQAIARLLASPALANQLIVAARQRVEQEYDVIQNSKDKAQLFLEAVK